MAIAVYGMVNSPNTINYFFTEVLPDTFTNNHISSVLDTGKLVATLKAE